MIPFSSMHPRWARRGSVVPGRHWSRCEDGRLRCDVCPRECRLSDGQRGLCFVRARHGDQIVLTTWGRSSGFCVDPIEKKPLNHFLPGTPVLSFGTAGCNLTCSFCQNWDISKSREIDTLADRATPETIARAAEQLGCRSVAFTYNDPVIFLEYAVDAAQACRERGIKTVAVTAGYVNPDARREFFASIDAANVDLKGFTERFYQKLCTGHLDPVLDTLRYLKHETSVWLEITTLLIPGENDSDEELHAASDWIVENLGPDVPWHFSAFHADFRMRDKPATPAATLHRARDDRAQPRRPVRLHRKRPRPRWAEHVLPQLRCPADRARLVRAGRVEPGRARSLRKVPDPVHRCLRVAARSLGRAAPAGAARRLRVRASATSS